MLAGGARAQGSRRLVRADEFDGPANPAPDRAKPNQRPQSLAATSHPTVSPSQLAVAANGLDLSPPRTTRLTSPAAVTLSNTSRNRPARSDVISDRNPMAGGPTRKPRYPRPLTVATPAPSLTCAMRPPAANPSGMIEENPAPAAANPASAQ